jgi:hypothetical protein
LISDEIHHKHLGKKTKKRNGTFLRLKKLTDQIKQTALSIVWLNRELLTKQPFSSTITHQKNNCFKFFKPFEKSQTTSKKTLSPSS